jgi:hypothetical protein
LREAGADENVTDQVLREVETRLGVRVQEGLELACVQQGTLEQDGNEQNGGDSNGQTEPGGDDAPAGLLDEFSSNAEYNNAEATAASTDDHRMDMDVAHEEAGQETEPPKGDEEWVVVENMDGQQGEPGAVSAEAAKQHAGDDGEAQQHGAQTSDVLQPVSMYGGADFDPFSSMGDGYEGGDSLLNFGGEFEGDASGGLGDGH